jgi:CDP-diacylglycerol--glycerol-3-phosphate 3-phosphatidyltransferase
VSKFNLHQSIRSLSTPIVAGLDAVGMNPTALTFLGLFLNFGAAYVVWTGHLVWGGLAYLLASAFDMLDGGLARRQGRVSRLGAFLDSTFDRLSETAMFVAIIHDITVNEYALPWLGEIALLALAGSLTTSYVRARAEGLNQECKVGWVERPERIVLTVVGMLMGRTILGFVIFALAVLSWITVVQRIAHVWRQLVASDRGGYE